MLSTEFYFLDLLDLLGFLSLLIASLIARLARAKSDPNSTILRSSSLCLSRLHAFKIATTKIFIKVEDTLRGKG